MKWRRYALVQLDYADAMFVLTAHASVIQGLPSNQVPIRPSPFYNTVTRSRGHFTTQKCHHGLILVQYVLRPRAKMSIGRLCRRHVGAHGARLRHLGPPA